MSDPRYPDDHVPQAAALPAPLRPQRLLSGLTGEESSRRFAPAPPPPPVTPARQVIKRTYELEETVVHGIRRQAIQLGVNANDLANALLQFGLAALADGSLVATVGILPEEALRGPRAAGRYITALAPRTPASPGADPPSAQEGA